jgi:DNA-binding transcriptional regulator YdaS (Cro superfamily)
MDLLSYIEDMGRRRELAEATGTSPDYLWQIATDRRRASTDLAKAIDEHTSKAEGMHVEKGTLRPDVWPPREAAA